MRFLENESSRRNFKFAVVALTIIIAVVAVSFQRSTLMLLGAGMLVTTLHTLLIATTDSNSVAESARKLSIYWTVLIVVLAGTVFYSGRQETGASFLEYKGVFFERGATVSFGVAPAGQLDVALPRPRDHAVDWRGEVTWRRNTPVLRFESIPAGMTVSLCKAALDVVKCEEDWQLLAGHILGDGDSILVRGGATLRIDRERDQWIATLGEARYPLGADIDTLFARRELLSRGAPLALLRDVDTPLLPIADHITLREIGRGESIQSADGSDASLLNRVRFQIASTIARFRSRDVRTGRFIVQLAEAANPATARAVEWPLNERVIVRAQTAQAGWRFQLDPETPLLEARPGVALRYVRNPRAPRFSLSAEDACAAESACNIVSLRALPAPTSYLFLGETGGPDTLRYRFQARAQEGGDSLMLLTAATRYGIPLNADGLSDVVVPRRGVDRKSPLSLLFSATRGSLGSSTDAMLAVGAIILLLLGVSSLTLGMNVGAHRITNADPEHFQSLMVIAAGVVTLAVTRGILALRVQLYPPFNDNVALTGIGMWPALAALVVALAFVPVHRWEHRQPSRSRSQSRSIWLAARSMLRKLRIVLTGGAKQVSQPAVWMLGVSAVFFAVVLKWALAFAIAIGVSVAAAFVGARMLSEVAERQRKPMKALGFSIFAVMLTLFFAVRIPVLLIIPLLIAFGLAPRRNRDDVLEWWLAFFVLVVPATLLAIKTGNNGAAANFQVVTAGILLTLRLAESLRRRHDAGEVHRGTTVLVVMAPALAFGFLAFIDVGLALVVALPLALAAYLRSGFFLGLSQRWAITGAMCVILSMFGLFSWKIANIPGTDWSIGDERRLIATFDAQRKFLGLEGLVPEALDRNASRRVAVYNPEAAQRLAVLAPGGYAQSTLVAAVEQHWGVQAYAAGGGIWGEGLGKVQVFRGVAEPVSYAENTFSVYVLGEHGAVGGIVVLLSYVVILLGAAWHVYTLEKRRERWEDGTEAFVGATLLAVPAAYVAASNVGLLPITGQNMPFLGINGWSDVIFCCMAVGLIIQGVRNGAVPAATGLRIEARRSTALSESAEREKP